MSRDLITLSGVSGVSLDITADAYAIKTQALNISSEILAVNDSDSQEIAAAALSNIKGILKALESSRTDIKRPVLDLGKLIDAKAAEFAQELIAEAQRLHGAIQTHFRNEKEKADAERRMAEALEAKRRAKAEEEARRVAEEAKKAEQAALNAKTEAEAARLDAEAKAKAEAATKAQQAAENVASAPVAAPVRAEKMTVRTIWKHRVTDITALLKARPEFVSLEPKTALINAEIRGGARDIPGLEIWEESDVTVRA
jgi:hypothetical protein